MTVGCDEARVYNQGGPKYAQKFSPIAENQEGPKYVEKMTTYIRN